MTGRKTFKRGPFLAAMADKLPFILANRTVQGRLDRLGKLRSALHADEILHHVYGEPVISSEVERSLVSWNGGCGYPEIDSFVSRLSRRYPRGATVYVALPARSILDGACPERSRRARNDKAPGMPLILAANRASAGDMFFNRRITGIGNFSGASDGHFQCLGNRDLCFPCARRGDFGGPSLEATGL